MKGTHKMELATGMAANGLYMLYIEIKMEKLWNARRHMPAASVCDFLA